MAINSTEMVVFLDDSVFVCHSTPIGDGILNAFMKSVIVFDDTLCTTDSTPDQEHLSSILSPNLSLVNKQVIAFNNMSSTSKHAEMDGAEGAESICPTSPTEFCCCPYHCISCINPQDCKLLQKTFLS